MSQDGSASSTGGPLSSISAEHHLPTHDHFDGGTRGEIEVDGGMIPGVIFRTKKQFIEACESFYNSTEVELSGEEPERSDVDSIDLMLRDTSDLDSFDWTAVRTENAVTNIKVALDKIDEADITNGRVAAAFWKPEGSRILHETHLSCPDPDKDGKYMIYPTSVAERFSPLEWKRHTKASEQTPKPSYTRPSFPYLVGGLPSSVDDAKAGKFECHRLDRTDSKRLHHFCSPERSAYPKAARAAWNNLLTAWAAGSETVLSVEETKARIEVATVRFTNSLNDLDEDDVRKKLVACHFLVGDNGVLGVQTKLGRQRPFSAVEANGDPELWRRTSQPARYCNELGDISWT